MARAVDSTDSQQLVEVDADDVLFYVHGSNAYAFNITTGHRLKEYPEHMQDLTSLHVLGSDVITSSIDGSVRWHTVKTGRERICRLDHGCAVTAMVLDRQRRLVLSGDEDGVIHCFRITDGEDILSFAAHKHREITTMVLDADYLYTAGMGSGDIRKWSLDDMTKRDVAAKDRLIRELEGHTDSVNAMQIDRHGNMWTCSEDMTARQWNRNDGTCKQSYAGAHEEGVLVLAYARGTRAGEPDLVYTGGRDNKVFAFDESNGNTVFEIDAGILSDVTQLVAQDFLYIACQLDPEVYQHDRFTGERIRTFSGHNGPVRRFIMWQHMLITCSEDMTCSSYDRGTGQRIRRMTSRSPPLTAMQVTEDEQFVLTASEGSASFLVQELTGKRRSWSLPADAGRVTASMMAVAGTKSTTGDEDSSNGGDEDDNGSRRRLVTSLLSRQARPLLLAAYAVPVVDASAEETSVVSDLEQEEETQETSHVILWNWVTQRVQQRFAGHTDAVITAMAQNALGTLLLTVATDGRCSVWLVESGEQVRRLDISPDSALYAVALLGSCVFAAGQDRLVHVWNVETAERVREYRGHTEAINALLIHNDMLFTASDDASIRVWRADSAEHIKTLQGHNDDVLDITIATGMLWSASRDETVRVWNLASGTELRMFEEHNTRVTQIVRANRRTVYSASTEIFTYNSWLYGWLGIQQSHQPLVEEDTLDWLAAHYGNTAMFLFMGMLLVVDFLQLLGFAFYEPTHWKSGASIVAQIQRLQGLGFEFLTFRVAFTASVVSIALFWAQFLVQERVERLKFAHPQRRSFKYTWLWLVGTSKIISRPLFLPIFGLLSAMPLCTRDGTMLGMPNVTCYSSQHLAWTSISVVGLAFYVPLVYRFMRVGSNLGFIEATWNPFNWSGDRFYARYGHPLSLCESGATNSMTVVTVKTLATILTTYFASMTGQHAILGLYAALLLCSVTANVIGFRYPPFFSHGGNAVRTGLDLAISWTYLCGMLITASGSDVILYIWAGMMPIVLTLGFMARRWYTHRQPVGQQYLISERAVSHETIGSKASSHVRSERPPSVLMRPSASMTTIQRASSTTTVNAGQRPGSGNAAKRSLLHSAVATSSTRSLYRAQNAQAAANANGHMSTLAGSSAFAASSGSDDAAMLPGSVPSDASPARALLERDRRGLSRVGSSSSVATSNGGSGSGSAGTRSAALPRGLGRVSSTRSVVSTAKGRASPVLRATTPEAMLRQAGGGKSRFDDS